MPSLPYFPIEVTESLDFYYVKIHPRERHLVSSINGRSWNGIKKKWVFPKKLSFYEKLTERFKTKSSIFKISLPAKEDTLETNHQKISSTNTLEIKSIENKLETVLDKMGLIGLSLSTQRQKIDSIFTTTVSTGKSLNSIESKVGDKNKKINFNLTNEFNVFFKNLLLSGEIDNKDENTKSIISEFNIEYPTEFVLETHKKLRIEIEKLVTPPEHDDSFPSLIRTAKQANNGDGIYQTSQRGEIIDVYNALHRLNKLRNELAHPAVNNSRKILYGIMYASIFVEIWEKVKQDD